MKTVRACLPYFSPTAVVDVPFLGTSLFCTLTWLVYYYVSLLSKPWVPFMVGNKRRAPVPCEKTEVDSKQTLLQISISSNRKCQEETVEKHVCPERAVAYCLDLRCSSNFFPNAGDISGRCSWSICSPVRPDLSTGQPAQIVCPRDSECRTDC